MLHRILLSLLLAWPGWAAALDDAQALAIVQGDGDARVAALHERLAAADPALAPFLRALLADEVRLLGGRAVRIENGTVPAGAEEVLVNNRLRREMQSALAALALLSRDAAERARALDELKEAPGPAVLPLVERALAAETQPQLRQRLQAAKAAAMLGSDDRLLRLDAARLLGTSSDPGTRALLLERQSREDDAEVRQALAGAARQVQQRLVWGERAGLAFTGISLGSVLMLAALGLAITYGLMGVINMAHGELMMIGAYATWLVQSAFRQWAPGAFDAYVLLAVPVSFLAAAAVGVAIERSVIRFLYGRPLETLLATWGISLILMQSARSLFGAQNVAVENPSWLSGGLAVLPNLTLPYSRLAVLAFAALVLLGVAWLVARTRVGLFVRGVTQNRRMAACLGVDTRRVDTLAFALGAGVAGLAGCALSQLGNVGPDLGQGWIVDSFMVVVLGGVGQLAGTVVAGLGLGVVSKLLEGWQGAVLAKIMVLALIVLFIQRRPQGLFALQGRSVD